MVFWSEKRPITVDLLKRVDLEKVAKRLGRSDEYRLFTKRDNNPALPLFEKTQLARSA